MPRECIKLKLLRQVIAQFSALVAQMQQILDDFPAIMRMLSGESTEFDGVLKIIRNSATGALIVLGLMIPFLWFSIFQNWRSKIMEMRQGRCVAVNEVLHYLLLILFCQGIFSTDQK